MSDDKPAPTYENDTVLEITFKDGSTERFQVLTSAFQGKGQEVVIPYSCIFFGSTVLFRDSGQKHWYAWKLLEDHGKVIITVTGPPAKSREDHQHAKPSGRIGPNPVSD